MSLFFVGTAYHRELHVLTHSVPTRRSSDLRSTSDEGTSHPRMQPTDYRQRRWSSRLASPPLRQSWQKFGGSWLRPSRSVQTDRRSEEHTSELQSLMRNSSAVF